MGDALMANGESANMSFVDDGLRPGDFRGAIVFPVEASIYHYAFEHVAGIIAGIKRQIGVMMAYLIAAVLIAQVQRAIKLLGVRVKQ